MSDSESNLSEDSKRKRGDENENEGIFSRSKKITRTPEKTKFKKPGDNQDEVKEMLKELLMDNKRKTSEMEEIKNIMSNIAYEMKEFRKENAEIKQQMQQLKKENKDLKKEINEMRQKMEKTEINVEYCQKVSKRNNLVIKGLPINTNDNETIKEDMQNFIKQELGIQAKICRASRINDRMCTIEMQMFEDKMKILRAKSKLRNKREDQIYIDCDYTLKEIDMQKNLREIAARERKNGKKVKMGYNFLIINGTKRKWKADINNIEPVTEQETKN